MIRLEDCEFQQLRSFDDEAAFFAQMGRFFASATVRRDCGGYPLTDGPRYRWFVARHKEEARILGFISVEQLTDAARIRDAYLRVEVRGIGLFRALRQQVLDHIDDAGLACTTRVLRAHAPLFKPHGFHIESGRGKWVTLKRNAHVTNRKPNEASRSPVSGARHDASETENRGAQRAASATA